MKAKFVYENLDFERGQDPKRSIGIGIEETFKEKLRQFLEIDALKEGNIEEIWIKKSYEENAIFFEESGWHKKASEKKAKKMMNYIREIGVSIGLDEFIDFNDEWGSIDTVGTNYYPFSLQNKYNHSGPHSFSDFSITLDK